MLFQKKAKLILGVGCTTQQVLFCSSWHRKAIHKQEISGLSSKSEKRFRKQCPLQKE